MQPGQYQINVQNAATVLVQITQALATATASLLPTVTVDGVTIDRAGYIKNLLDSQKIALEMLQKIAGPFQITSVAR